MPSLLKDRLRQAMDAASPRITQADLARACAIKPASVNNWLSGKTKTIEGANLLNAAKRLNVSPEWLATGKGPRERSADEQFRAARLGESVTSGQERPESQSMTPDPQILAEAMKWVVFEEGPLVKKPSGSLEPQYPYGTLIERMQRLSEIYALAAADGGTLSPITAQSLIDAARKRHNLGDVDSERREIASSSGGRSAKR